MLGLDSLLLGNLGNDLVEGGVVVDGDGVRTVAVLLLDVDHTHYLQNKYF